MQKNDFMNEEENVRKEVDIHNNCSHEKMKIMEKLGH